jgi:signal transduction histidine kinase
MHSGRAIEAVLAAALRDSSEDLVRRWLERIADRLPLPQDEVFPTESLLDHVPLLVEGIADFIEDPADEITADVPVVGKAMELGELRHSQGFDVHQILKEYEILGGVLFDALGRAGAALDGQAGARDLLRVGHRLFRAIAVIQQATTGHYLRISDARVREREERLRSFNRAVSHELKNRIGTVLGGAEMLQEEWVVADPARRERFSSMVLDNTLAIRDVIDNLIELSRMDSSARRRNILLPDAVAEVVRQLRDHARAHGVELRVARELPRVEVPAAAVELCLSNYLSNAIKYHDPAKDERWAMISASIAQVGRSQELRVLVTDNGIGVADDARAGLFRRFSRGKSGTVQRIEGTGLGLSIVRETIASLGGRAWAEFPDEGTVFAFAIPCRRDRDSGSAAAD